MVLDVGGVVAGTAEFAGWTQARIAERGLLVDAPLPGGAVVERRSAEGEELLWRAKGFLYALLFRCSLPVVQRQQLTITLPASKAGAFAFLGRAPVPSHPGARIEVEYGDTADQLVGHGIAAALRLINRLEVNEVVLHARMADVEESSLR
ncbi:hypothetical protein [Actinokineospora sp. NPDC004072]